MNSKVLLTVSLLLALSLLAADPQKAARQKAPLWDGNLRGMELVTIGHKKVTVYLADGRTTEWESPSSSSAPSPQARAHPLNANQHELSPSLQRSSGRVAGPGPGNS